MWPGRFKGAAARLPGLEASLSAACKVCETLRQAQVLALLAARKLIDRRLTKLSGSIEKSSAQAGSRMEKIEIQ